jgi:hypothetical protein
MDAINARTAGTAHGLFTREEVLQDGFTDKDLKSAACHRVIHGVYRTESTPLTHELRCRAAALVLPAESVITARSAATLHGVPLARPSDPVEVLVPDARPRYGIRSWRLRNKTSDSTAWNGLRLATPARTALDLLTRNSVELGVAYTDALLHAGLITKEGIARFLSGRHDHRIKRARLALELLDGRAESVPESVLRVRFVREGLNPVPQLEIPGEFGTTLRGDLGFEEEKVLVEYDGAWHADPAQFEHDERRREWLRANGWLVFVVTAADLANSMDRVIREVADALRDRRRGV